MLKEHQKSQLRQIPAVHELLEHASLRPILEEEQVSRELLTQICQESTQEVRELILNNDTASAKTSLSIVLEKINDKVSALIAPTLKPLINGTGVILHTNLGRAKLSKAAQLELLNVAKYYSNLEFKLSEGTRGSRHAIVEQLICRLTGAEAAIVCNNNASAVFLTLKSLAQNKEVIVSRGELVEIGGSFRISEIMQESGAILKEVGTTNKTHLYDYERAISDDTRLIMKVHTSNFVIKGFTASVAGTDLVALANLHSIPVFEDLGSGVLLDLRPFGIGQEPTVQEVIHEGVDLVSFSGDKLLGGPQAGIIAGKKKYIDRLKKHQLMRSLRVDKFTLATLHATLKAYLNPQKALQEIPTLHMLLEEKVTIKKKAEKFIASIDESYYSTELIEVESEVGGGTMPDVRIPSWGVHIESKKDKHASSFSKRLREAPFPIIGRIHNDRFLLDFRTIDEEEIPLIISSLKKIQTL
jgi:L-seryl-tRNA(Ser) seleniumtransferase